MKTPPELDALADSVLAHRPGGKPLQAIAGSPDRPLVIGEIEISCYVLEDETRVLSQREVFRGVGASRGGSTNGGAQIPRFLASKAINPFIHRDLSAALNSPIRFHPPQGGRIAYGYPARLLVEICQSVLAARDANALGQPQKALAERCDLLIRGLATVGIEALVDEATGYQRIRAESALTTILKRFIAKDLQPWTQTFDYAFYEQMFRLKGWGSPEGVKRPSVIGHYTNDFVYARIAPGVLDELRRKNPVLPQGWRKARHHQCFTPDIGHPKLKEHLAGVTALMRAAATWDGFKRTLERAYPKINATFAMPLDDE